MQLAKTGWLNVATLRCYTWTRLSSQVCHTWTRLFSGTHVQHLDKTRLSFRVYRYVTPGEDFNDYSGRVYNTSPVNHVDSYHSNSFVNYKMTNLTTATTQICNNTTTVCVPDWTLIPLSWSNLTSSVVTCVHRSISLNVLVSRDCYE